MSTTKYYNWGTDLKWFAIFDFKKLTFDLPVYISVFFSEIFIKVPIKNRICKRVEHSKKMQNCINHCFVPGNGTFHNFWIHVHQKVEYIQWQPGYKKDNRNTQNHDIGPSPFFIVLGMLALKLKFTLAKNGNWR